MDIHIIRHGMTMANEKKLYCGQTDLPLSENGINALAESKDQGIHPGYPTGIDLFFTSGLLRAEQTLKLLYGSVSREVLPGLAEYNFGQFEMKSYEELKDDGVFKAWMSDKNGLVSCPGGENKKQFVQRILKGYNLLLEKSRQAGTILAVCHGGVITCLMDHLFPGVRNFYDWQPEPGHGYTLVYASGELVEYREI